ncbi:MAG TPA: MFS transporter [Tepidisphaeraceae bacterium]|jgi:MFS family permease|nr:MFS transporter [Tepidisphaeraceae bacterium]
MPDSILREGVALHLIRPTGIIPPMHGAVTNENQKTVGPEQPVAGAWIALSLLLAINMFNYIDRYVLAAVEPAVQKDFFKPDNPNAEFWMGLLATAFMVSYLVLAPIFGWLADRMSRWLLVGISVILWSLASGASGMASFFVMLLITRLFVGVGEAGYGPAAPTIIADLYPVSRRGSALSWFYAAIPVGSALGYVLGGFIAHRWGWRAAFYAVVPPGILLGGLCFFVKDPSRAQKEARGRKATIRDYAVLFKTPSYVLDTLGMAAMTFAIGGISFWIPKYFVDQRHAGDLATVNSTFGAIVVVGGLLATLAGGWAGDRFRRWHSGAYFIVSAIGILAACPFVIAMLYAPFPWAWVMVAIAVFCLFFNTGPSNAILANVTHPSIRATGFAVNICAIHILGDAASPPLLGKIGHHSWNAAFLVVAAAMAVAGALWLWGARYLERDTAMASSSPTNPL